MKMRGIGLHSEIQLVAQISVVDRQRIMEQFSLRPQKRKENDSLRGFYAATQHLVTLKIQPPNVSIRGTEMLRVFFILFGRPGKTAALVLILNTVASTLN